MYSVYRESVVRKSVSAWQHWAVGSRRLLISLYNCIQAPAPGGHHQPLPSLANTGPGWIKLCGYSRRYRAGPYHHREPWGQARTRQRSLLIRSQSVSVVTKSSSNELHKSIENIHCFSIICTLYCVKHCSTK